VDTSFVAFLGLSALVIMTPGQDTALTIRSTLLGGRGTGIATAFGVAAGQTVWTVAASTGLTALLIASEPAFLAIRLIGAGYLVILGAQTLWAAIRPGEPAGASGAPRGARGLRPRRALRQGLVSNIGNPKMAIFFTSMLPQFVPQGPSAFGAMVGLGVVFAAMTLAWLCLYAAVVARAGDVLRRPRIRRTLDALMGTILMAFGVRLGTEPR
jgi:threonine/homoserine/homoserine lactone efflux protein